MRIGILGSGLMGEKLGTVFARAGYEVVFARRGATTNSRDWHETPKAMHAPVRRARLQRKQTRSLLAGHWSRIDDVLKLAGDLSGKVIVTCSLPMNADDTRLVIAHTSSGAEALAKKVRKAAVVSAFSSVPSEVLFDVFDAKRRTRRRR